MMIGRKYLNFIKIFNEIILTNVVRYSTWKWALGLFRLNTPKIEIQQISFLEMWSSLSEYIFWKTKIN
jgi:hypothetical protein